MAVEKKSRAATPAPGSAGERACTQSQSLRSFRSLGTADRRINVFLFFLFPSARSCGLSLVACRNELAVLLTLYRKFGSENTCRCCGNPVHAIVRAVAELLALACGCCSMLCRRAAGFPRIRDLPASDEKPGRGCVVANERTLRRYAAILARAFPCTDCRPSTSMQAIRTLSCSAPGLARLATAPPPHLIASFAAALVRH